jgi:hypothetical protein
MIVHSQSYLKSEKRDYKRYTESLIGTCELLEKSIDKNFEIKIRSSNSSNEF